MYKKILWWIKNYPERPLTYNLIITAIYAEKVDPEPYYNPKYMPYEKEEFINDCKKPTTLYDDEYKIHEEFKKATNENLSSLIGSEIWQEIMMKDSIVDFIAEKTFDSQDEIRKLCSKIYSDYLNESVFMSDLKTIMKAYGQRGVMFTTQMKNLGRNVGSREKWIDSTANQYWFGYNAIKCITKRVRELLECEQKPELYLKSVVTLKEYFNFSDLQIEMLKYFFCQSIEGTCPAHKNKAIFIWGDNKDAGKTTIASTIVSILNGEKNINNVRFYKSNLAQELGWKEHTAPMICSCRAVLMDEAMPKDSSKSYGTFKDRITSDGVKIRFVFQNQIDVDAKANYVFTSNDPLDVFVQDKTERRFLEFHIEKKFKSLTYDMIYEAFLNFAKQCKRDRDWVAWYDSMSKDTEVRGLESKDIEDVKSFFETPSFISEIINGSSQISVGVFYQHVFKFDKNASKQIIQKCIIDLFGEPMRPSTWRKSDVLKVLKETEAYDHVTNIFNKDEENPF